MDMEYIQIYTYWIKLMAIAIKVINYECKYVIIFYLSDKKK